jgi:hypothetical protein
MGSLRERIGERIGVALAPLIHRIAQARHARMFHPEGDVFVARVEALGATGEALAGPALAIRRAVYPASQTAR